MPELDQARLWLWQGMLRGDAEPAQAVLAKSRAVELYRRLGDSSGLGFSLVQVAMMLGYMDRFEAAETALAEASPLLESRGHAQGARPLLRNYGFPEDAHR